VLAFFAHAAYRSSGRVFARWNAHFQWQAYIRRREYEMVKTNVIWNPGANSPRAGAIFVLNLFSVRADVFVLGKFQGPVSIRSAASEHIPLGGAVLL
jgi:hypothetical protein